LDTGVFLAAWRGDSGLHERAVELLADSTREFVYSDITELELLPQPSFHGKEDEIAFYRGLFARFHRRTVDAAFSNRALQLACELGLHAADAMHLQHALDHPAREFVTTERDTKPLYRANNAQKPIVVRAL
jgi:predicted nucleic acid-binding protein